MTEETPERAPQLGEQTDIEVDDATTADVLRDDGAGPAAGSDEPPTMETPDELGGTGGPQAGGAG